MSKFYLIAIVFLLFLQGCASYPHKVFKQNTGMEFGKEVNLCPGGSVKSFKTCEPAGEGWKKGSKVTGSQLAVDDKIFQRIGNSYLLQRLSGFSRIPVHGYDLWGSNLNFPRSEITVEEKLIEKAVQTDFIPETYVKVEIAEIYEKKAVEEAIVVLEAEAKAKNIAVSADFLASVESHLKSEIKNTKNSELTYHYISAQYIGKLSQGEEDPNLIDNEKMKPSLEEFDKGNKLITGISGFLFGKFEANQKVFEKTMFSNAIDASVDFLSDQQIQQIEEIKSSASLKWSNKINEEINTDIHAVDTGVFFYPLWYKSISKQ